MRFGDGCLDLHLVQQNKDLALLYLVSLAHLDVGYNAPIGALNDLHAACRDDLSRSATDLFQFGPE